MKTLIISILMLTMTASFAQNTVTWKGGTPGRETSWNEPRNWSTYQVPDAFSHVVIQALNTGHHIQPIIDQEVEVASLRIYTGANLSIKKGGEVLIDGDVQTREEMVRFGGFVLIEAEDQVIPKMDEVKVTAPRMAKQ